MTANQRPGSRSLRHRPRRCGVDLKQPARGQRRGPRPRRAAPEHQRRHPRAHADRLERIGDRRPPPGRRINERPAPAPTAESARRSAPPATGTAAANRAPSHPAPQAAPRPAGTPPAPSRQQRLADHLHDIPPARQAHVRQQHMRRPARPLPATAATRPQPPHPRKLVRTSRNREQPQPPNTPARQRGHTNRPAARSASTTARSSETMSTTTSNGVTGPLVSYRVKVSARGPNQQDHHHPVDPGRPTKPPASLMFRVAGPPSPSPPSVSLNTRTNTRTARVGRHPSRTEIRLGVACTRTTNTGTPHHDAGPETNPRRAPEKLHAGRLDKGRLRRYGKVRGGPLENQDGASGSGSRGPGFLRVGRAVGDTPFECVGQDQGRGARVRESTAKPWSSSARWPCRHASVRGRSRCRAAVARARLVVRPDGRAAFARSSLSVLARQR